MEFDDNNPAYQCGQQHVDLFLGFSCFLYETCNQRAITDLYFCTREGVFFKAVFDALFCRSPETITVRSHLLEASRLSVFPATVLKESSLDLSGLFRLYKKQSATTILKSLGLHETEFEDLLKKYDLDPSRLESEPMAIQLLSDFLRDKQFIAKAYPQLQKQRTSALDYLTQKFGDSNHIGFVDIGWRGTIQNSIATLMPERQFLGLYMGLALERNVMQPNCEKLAYGPNQNESRENVDLLHAVNVLEFVCLSTGGSAAGYERNDSGHYQARMKVDSKENHEIEAFSIPFQQGVIHVASTADPMKLLQSHRQGELKNKAVQRWRNLIKQPPQELVDAYFSLTSNETFGLGTLANQSAIPSLRRIAAALFSRIEREQLITFLTYNQWADGYKKRTDLPWTRRWLIYWLMLAAEKYKHFKLKYQKQACA